MAAAQPRTITTFSPDTARQIARYVKEEMRRMGSPTNPVKGRWVSTKQCFAKITGNNTADGISTHSWSEVWWDFTNKEWIEVPDGREGTTASNFLISVDPTEVLDTDKVFFAVLQDDADTGMNIWVGISSSSLPVFQYPGMVYICVTNNVMAGAYPFAVNTV